LSAGSINVLPTASAKAGLSAEALIFIS